MPVVRQLKVASITKWGEGLAWLSFLWGSLLLVLIFFWGEQWRDGCTYMRQGLFGFRDGRQGQEGGWILSFSSPSFLVFFLFFLFFFCIDFTFLPASCKLSRTLSLIILGFGHCWCHSYHFLFEKVNDQSLAYNVNFKDYVLDDRFSWLFTIEQAKVLGLRLCNPTTMQSRSIG